MPVKSTSTVSIRARAYRAALRVLGGLSHPSKMPCASYSIPATRCRTGSKLAKLAGTVCSNCYALKGCYTFPSTQRAMARRMRVVDRALADAHAGEAWVDAFVIVLRERLARTERALARNGRAGRDDGRVFRWHDSGDLQSVAHLKLIAAVAARTPRVRHWLPTREAKDVATYLAQGGALPQNLCVRLSVPRIDDALPAGFLRMLADPQVAASGVHAAHGQQRAPFAECGAYRNAGACGDCRACWDPAQDVSYPLH